MKTRLFITLISYFLEVSIPRITISHTTPITARQGSNINFTCQAYITPKSYVIGVTIQWKYKSLSSKESLPDKINTSVVHTNSSFVTSILTIPDIQYYNGGKYYCLAVLKITGGRDSKSEYYKVLNIGAGWFLFIYLRSSS